MVEIRQLVTYKGGPPDIERIISIHPQGWVELAGSSTDPEWKEALQGEYDVAASRTYRNVRGDVVMVVMTWSRDGIRRAGHLQQVCYQVNGCTVSVPSYATLDSKSGRRDVVVFSAFHDDNAVEDVVYWRITGGKPDMHTEYATFMATRFDKLNRLAKYMFSGMPDNVMFRVSALRSSPDRPASAHIDYARQFLEVLPSNDRKLLMGKR
ncbi:MAG: exosortase-associated EpsI family protein [Pelodictyon phaeoclathratiforme]